MPLFAGGIGRNVCQAQKVKKRNIEHWEMPFQRQKASFETSKMRFRPREMTIEALKMRF